MTVLSVVTATPTIQHMERFNNVAGPKPDRQHGMEERGMNARKAKAMRRAISLMVAENKVKPAGYALVEDRGMIVATGARMAYKQLKKAVR